MAKFRTLLVKQVSLKQIRDNRTYSIQAIMDATGVHRTTIDRWMKGTLSRLDYDTLTKLAAWLECEPSDLYEVVEDEEPDKLAALVA